MANVTLKGAIAAIFDSQIIGTNFEKRAFWLKEQDVEFPQTYNLEMQQGDCNKLDKYKVGDLVECQVAIRGRAGKKRDGTGDYCINTLKVWSIVRIKPGMTTEAKPGMQTNDEKRVKEKSSFDEDAPDDLPF